MTISIIRFGSCSWFLSHLVNTIKMVLHRKISIRGWSLSSLPWNQMTFSGYFGEIAFSTVICPISLIVNGAFYDIFEHSIDKWNHLDKNLCDESFICDRIRFHVPIKRSNSWENTIHISIKDLLYFTFPFLRSWFLQSAKVYNPFVVVQLISSVMVSAIFILYLDMVCWMK